MKKISLRLPNPHAHWLRHQARLQQISVAQHLRDLIEWRQNNPNKLERSALTVETTAAETATLKHLPYLMMTRQLLEQLVLNEENGIQKREAADAEVLETLRQLQVSPYFNESYKLTVLIEAEQWAWLTQQAQALKKTIVHVVRKIIALQYREAHEKHTPHLTVAEQESIKAALTTFTLLKGYIENAYEEGQTLITRCEQEARALYQKLYPNDVRF